MELREDICYQAVRARDPRFDGRFFSGVSSTGIFCRPICPARTPKRENLSYFSTAAAAHEAGFRPCLRCRPEASPASPAWEGTTTTVRRALRLIQEGALDHSDVDTLAARVGIGGRHLRALFGDQLGVSPKSMAVTRRCLFAKQLLTETALPITDIALASGFGSLRRFNDAFLNLYHRPPRDIRRRTREETAAAQAPVCLKLAYRTPLDWTGMLAYLAARAFAGVESVADGSYRRTLRLGQTQGVVAVRDAGDGRHLLAEFRIDSVQELLPAVTRLRRLFDLDTDITVIDEHLGPAFDLQGLRVPGAWNGFELAVRAILGQQVSVRGATTLAGRLVTQFGDPVDAGAGLTHYFPDPATLSQAPLEQIGIPASRALAFRSLAAAVAEQRIRLDSTADPEQVRHALLALPGIGPWTADYIALRALRDPDAFPVGDLGLQKRVEPGRRLNARELESKAQAWRPYRGYAAMYYWTR